MCNFGCYLTWVTGSQPAKGVCSRYGGSIHSHLIDSVLMQGYGPQLKESKRANRNGKNAQGQNGSRPEFRGY